MAETQIYLPPEQKQRLFGMLRRVFALASNYNVSRNADQRLRATWRALEDYARPLAKDIDLRTFLKPYTSLPPDISMQTSLTGYLTLAHDLLAGDTTEETERDSLFRRLQESYPDKVVTTEYDFIRNGQASVPAPRHGGYQPRIAAVIADLAFADAFIDDMVICTGPDNADRDSYVLITVPARRLQIAVSDRVDAPAYIVRGLHDGAFWTTNAVNLADNAAVKKITSANFQQWRRDIVAASGAHWPQEAPAEVPEEEVEEEFETESTAQTEMETETKQETENPSASALPCDTIKPDPAESTRHFACPPATDDTATLLKGPERAARKPKGRKKPPKEHSDMPEAPRLCVALLEEFQKIRVAYDPNEKRDLMTTDGLRFIARHGQLPELHRTIDPEMPKELWWEYNRWLINHKGHGFFELLEDRIEHEIINYRRDNDGRAPHANCGPLESLPVLDWATLFSAYSPPRLKVRLDLAMISSARKVPTPAPTPVP